jgi:hypothetical protein
MISPILPKEGPVKVRTFVLEGTRDAPLRDLANSRPSELESFLETISSHLCPRCGRKQLNIYFSSNTEGKLGVWCENCNLRGYFESGELVSMKTTASLNGGS